MGLLQELNQKDGVLVVIVTHEQDISQHCERVISLYDGEIMSDERVANRRWAVTLLDGGGS